MNTGAVSKLLGVSTSTIQRWTKHLELDMERNELGHYYYSERDIRALKELKEKIQQGIPLQEIKTNHKTRRGSTRVQERKFSQQHLIDKINNLERELNGKADSVVSYQLLQHRQEIEELRTQIEGLRQLIESNLETEKMNQPPQSQQISTNPEKRKKKTILKSLFGF